VLIFGRITLWRHGRVFRGRAVRQNNSRLLQSAQLMELIEFVTVQKFLPLLRVRILLIVFLFKLVKLAI